MAKGRRGIDEELGLDWIGLGRLRVHGFEWMDRIGFGELDLDWIWTWMGFGLKMDWMDLVWNGLDQAGNIFLIIFPMDGNPPALLMKS